MASQLTPNLKLKIDSNLTANAKYNLNRIDSLAAVYLLDNTETVNIRSKVDINLLPENASTGGSGIGGTINASTASQPLDEFNIYSNSTNLGKNARLNDNAVGGTKKLEIIYDSSISGTVDTIADRQLAFDLAGADRELVLEGSVALLGQFDLILNLTADTDITLPETGTVATLANPETFLNKTIDADVNTLLNIDDNEIKANAGIQYSKLNLTGSIINADINSAAGIVYSKLVLSNSIINSDINSGAAIAYSKLNLLASIVNADIAPGANIDASKLSLTGSITDNEVATGAAIQGSKILPDFGAQDISTSGRLILKGPSFQTEVQAAQSGQIDDLLLTLPSNNNSGVLANDGSGNLSWISVGGTGTVTSVGLSLPSIFNVSGSPVTAAGTLTGTLATQTANTVFSGPSTGIPATPTFRALAVADIPVSSIDHDNLLNGAGSKHIDHAAVSITTSANSGLSGGGTIAASRSLAIDPTNAPLATAASNDILLISDTSAAGALAKVLVSDIVALAGNSYSADWTSGTSFIANHALNSRLVMIQLYDNTTFETIMVDSEVRTDVNNVTLTASPAPSGAGWKVMIKRI